MKYHIGQIENIQAKDFEVVSVEAFKKGIDFIMLRNKLKNGKLGKLSACFFSDKRVTSLKVHRLR
jgi:hypothetical protein